MGRVKHAWQDRAYVLSWFGTKEKEALGYYREYVEEGVSQGRRPELVGGGLIRSAGGWSGVRSLRVRKERVRTDERILGAGEFVEQILEEAEERLRRQVSVERRMGEAKGWISRECEREGISEEELRQGSRRRRVSEVRRGIARGLVMRFGLPLADVARELGVTPSGISRALAGEPGT